MPAYDPSALCNAAAHILVYSAPGTPTKTAMKCAGFYNINEEYNIYRKRIERIRKKTKSHPLLISVDKGSVSSTSTISCSVVEASNSALFYIVL